MALFQPSPKPNQTDVRHAAPEGESIARNMRQLEQDFDGVVSVMAVTAHMSFVYVAGQP